jgi:alcohol dehydrogenase class IV
VLTNAETGVKKSFRHPSFVARLVMLDADLLAFCPPDVIASAGMDAFTQAIESYTSTGATWFSDELALKAISLMGASLETVFANPKADRNEDLLLGSYLAGVALSNARLGVVHGLAHPLGARYHVPHGLACAVCLPHALEFNRETIGPKYEAMSRTVGADLLTFTRRWLKTFHILSPFAGKTIPDREAVVRETLASGSTAANPRPVTAADVVHLLDGIFAG